MLDRRQILAIFLFKFKMNHKAVETACNINYTLAQKLLTNTQGTGASRNFTKEMAPWRWGGWWPAIESGQQPIKGHHWSSYSYTRSCPRTVSTILWSCIWSQLERWKSLISGCLMIWLKIKKKCHFEVPSSHSMRSFLYWIVIHDKKWVLYNQWQPAQWLDEEEARKHFPKPNLHQKKGHGQCLVVFCPCDPVQISESQRNRYI